MADGPQSKLADAFELSSYRLDPDTHADEPHLREEHHHARCLRPDCGWTNVILDFEGGRGELERTAANHLAWHEDLSRRLAADAERAAAERARV